MITPEDDFPLHQSPVPFATVMDGHPNAYDRYFFNLYDRDFYAGIALGLYPNRGVIDGAFSVVVGDKQYCVLTSDALVGRPTHVGPISIDIVEPMRVNRITVSAPEHGLVADLTYTASTEPLEEQRHTLFDQGRIMLDVTRASQLGNWQGFIETPEGRREIQGMAGSKDRSWGIRPVGEPTPSAPTGRSPQICFLWAPVHTPSGGAHYMSFRNAQGMAEHESAGIFGATSVPTAGALSLQWQRGTRWPSSATLRVGERSHELTPTLRFQMRGLGYSHPTHAHGRWHGGAVTIGEVLELSTVSPLDPSMIHTQHVVSVDNATVGVVETLMIGPYEPAGCRELLDGAP